MFAKFLKDMISYWEEVTLTMECGMQQNKLSPKLKDPGGFTLPISPGKAFHFNILCDTSASIKLMPLSTFRKQGVEEIKGSNVMLQLTDKSIKYLWGKIEDISRLESLYS